MIRNIGYSIVAQQIVQGQQLTSSKLTNQEAVPKEAPKSKGSSPGVILEIQAKPGTNPDDKSDWPTYKRPRKRKGNRQ